MKLNPASTARNKLATCAPSHPLAKDHVTSKRRTSVTVPKIQEVHCFTQKPPISSHCKSENTMFKNIGYASRVTLALLTITLAPIAQAQVYYDDPSAHAQSTPAVGFSNPHRSETRRHTARAALAGGQYVVNARAGRLSQARNNLSQVYRSTRQAYDANRQARTYRYPPNPYESQKNTLSRQPR